MTALRARLERLHPALEVTPGRPAIVAGVRGAIATVLPLVVGGWLGLPNVAWTAFGSFTACLADSGGAYRTRASTYGALAVVLMAGVVLGSFASITPATAIAGMFAWGVATQLLRVYPTAFGNVTVSATVAFAVALTAPYGGIESTMSRALYTAAGVVLAMLLALGSAPVRYYRPARRATARCYRALSERCAAFARAVTSTDPRTALRALHAENPALRDAIDGARVVIADTRTRREGESQRGELLLVLAESADQIYATTLAMLDVLEESGVENVGAASQAFDVLTRALAEIADVVESEATVASLAVPSVAPPPSSELGALVARCDTFVHAAAESAAALSASPSVATLSWLWPRVSPSRESIVEPLRANLSSDSVVLRHALRMGVVSAIGVAFIEATHVMFGEWVLIAIAIVLQPYSGATTVKGVQRLLGTALGGAIAAVIGSAFHSPTPVMVAILFLSGISVALYPLNYAAYAAFMTPTFVLLDELGSQSWHLASVRLANNLIGALLALVGAVVLWPARERPRETLASALAAVRDYLGDVLRRQHDPHAATLTLARRRVNVALANAHASLQRLVMERSRTDADVEAVMTVLSYTRRLAVSITAFAVTAEERAPFETLPAWVEPFERDVAAVLDDVVAALRGAAVRDEGAARRVRDRIPAEAAALTPGAERIARQLVVLQRAVERAMVAAPHRTSARYSAAGAPG